MRRLRRSSRSPSSGDPVVDGRHRALVGILGEMATELQTTEHCQDMNDFYDDLVELTEQRLDLAAQGDWVEAESDERFRGFLSERMPLPARDGPACKDCELCEVLEDQVHDWLGDMPTRSRRRKSGSVA
jgi:hypothetical protein